MLMLMLSPLLLLSLFVIFHSLFYSVFSLHSVSPFITHTHTNDCFHRSCVICFLFSVFFILSSNAPFKSAYFYASFSACASLLRFFCSMPARYHPGLFFHHIEDVYVCVRVRERERVFIHFHKSLLNGLLHCNVTAMSGLS